jgi:hypothetical protein
MKTESKTVLVKCAGYGERACKRGPGMTRRERRIPAGEAANLADAGVPWRCQKCDDAHTILFNGGETSRP